MTETMTENYRKSKYLDNSFDIHELYELIDEFTHLENFNKVHPTAIYIETCEGHISYCYFNADEYNKKDIMGITRQIDKRIMEGAMPWLQIGCCMHISVCETYMRDLIEIRL